VQFHPEVDAAQLGRWIQNGIREEMQEAGIDPVASSPTPSITKPAPVSEQAAW